MATLSLRLPDSYHTMVKEITTKDIAIEDIDSLVIYISGVVRAEFDEMFFTITKLSDEIENGRYMMPEYKFVRKRG